MSRLVSIGVVGQSPLVGHVLLPADVTRMGGPEANRPVLDRHLDGRRTRAWPAAARLRSPAAIDIRPSIGGILKNAANPRAVSFPPDDVVRARPEERTNGQRQPVGAQETHHGSCGVQFPELCEDQLDARPHLLIGVENDRARPIKGEPSRNGQTEFAARRLLAFALMQPHADLMQLRLAHDSGKPEQQSIVIDAGIVKTFAVGDQNAEDGAEFEKLMPVAVVARQTGGVEADDETGVAQADLGDQLLEPMPFGPARARLSQILVNDVDALRRDPSATARSTRRYCSSVLSWCCRT